MAVIAFLNQNIAIACVWGTFSVLLGSVETRLGVGRELSTLAVPLVNLTTALCAPVAGTLAARYSLRVVMLGGAVLSLAGFVTLALTDGFALYLAAFALLLGPGMAAGAVLPSTLITRWFPENRGRVLGVVSAPVLVAIIPLVSNWWLQAYGIASTYGLLGGLTLVTVVANLFIVDQPSEHATMLSETSVAEDDGGRYGSSMGAFLQSPGFWGLLLGFVASISGSIILTAHMVPMSQSWGMSSNAAAALLSIQSLVGIAGTVLFGWIADRLGGKRALILLVLDTSVLWVLLLLEPPFALAAILIGLIGSHGAGAGPVFCLALTERFGRTNFSRAYGLANLLNLPFSVLAVPAAALVYAQTGSYAGAILGEAVFLLLSSAMICALVRRDGADIQNLEPRAHH